VGTNASQIAGSFPVFSARFDLTINAGSDGHFVLLTAWTDGCLTYKEQIGSMTTFDVLVNAPEDSVILVCQCRLLITIEICFDYVTERSFRFANPVCLDERR